MEARSSQDLVVLRASVETRLLWAAVGAAGCAVLIADDAIGSLADLPPRVAAAVLWSGFFLGLAVRSRVTLDRDSRTVALRGPISARVLRFEDVERVFIPMVGGAVLVPSRANGGRTQAWVAALHLRSLGIGEAWQAPRVAVIGCPLTGRALTAAEAKRAEAAERR